MRERVAQILEERQYLVTALKDILAWSRYSTRKLTTSCALHRIECRI